jgi:phenylacetate-CoA ligase
LREYIEFINKYQPTWIEAYVQPIYELALFAERNGLEIHSPNGVLTSAGTLYPNMKEKLEEIFKCKIWNRYGSREVGDMAYGNDRLKLSVWNQLVEVKDKTGKIYVTTLNNFSMPLIRFDIGDIARMDKKWGYFEKVEGRESSALRNHKGKIIPGLLFVHFLGVVMNDGSIKRFQMIQKDYEEIEIKVVIKDQEVFENARPEIEKLICDAMESECEVNWIKVDDIPPLKSGKYLYVKSEIK